MREGERGDIYGDCVSLILIRVVVVVLVGVERGESVVSLRWKLWNCLLTVVWFRPSEFDAKAEQKRSMLPSSESDESDSDVDEGEERRTKKQSHNRHNPNYARRAFESESESEEEEDNDDDDEEEEEEEEEQEKKEKKEDK